MENDKNMIAVSYSIAVIIFTVIIGLALHFTIDEPRYDLILSNDALLLKGILLTVAVSIGTLIGALILGFVLFIMKRSSYAFLRGIVAVFSEIIMGTPLLVMIFLVVYPLGQMLGIEHKLLLGIFAMILYNSPYIMNAYETAAAVVTREEYTVMELYQFKWYQKYAYVILPQMTKPFLPSLINNLSSVIKGSALLNIISVSEITYVVKVISNKNFAVIEGYYVMWIMYLIITIPLSILAQYIGKKVTK